MDGTGQRNDGCKLEDSQQQQQQQQASGSQAERGVKRGRKSMAAPPAPNCGPGVEPVQKIVRPEMAANPAQANVQAQQLPAENAAVPMPGQPSWGQGNAVRPYQRMGRQFAARVNHGAGPSMRGRPRQQRVMPTHRAPYPPLPMFDGNPLHWANFHLAWLDSNQQVKFSDDENRERLRQALCGVAMMEVHQLLTAGQPPAVIYNALHRRFHHIAHHFAILLQQVYETVRPASPNMLAMLCSYRDALVELIRNLHLHRVHLMMNNCEVANYLAAMLPAEFFRTWSLYFSNGDNLYGLLAFIQLKLTNLQRSAILLDSPSETEHESDQ